MLSINVSELIWTIINFFLLYFLLKRFLYDPMVKFMDARQARIDEGLKRESDAREELRTSEERAERELSLSRAEARELIAAAQSEDDERSASCRAETERAAAQARELAVGRAAEEARHERAAVEADVELLADVLARSVLQDGQ